ncbi:SEC-C domain-containing protein [candidate division KSB1 bacterium]|nr:SEC-C domain-containing protein [candidate division KSB1 bacterium]
MQKKLKIKKVKFNKDDYEGYQYGPLKIERYGKNIIYSSDWTPDEFEKHIEKTKKERPNLKIQIDQKVQELVKALKSSNILHVLTSIAFQNIFFNPEVDTESSFEGNQAYIEFALSVITALEEYSFPEKSGELSEKETDDEVEDGINEKIKNLIKDILDTTIWYFASENVVKKDSREKSEIRYLSLMNFLFVRGDSYNQHNLELMKELFTPHNEFLNTHFGITIDQVLVIINDIEQQIEQNLKRQVEQLTILKKMHGLYIKYAEDPSNFEGLTFEDFMNNYKLLPEVVEYKNELDLASENIKNILFEIDVQTNKKFMDNISISLGENKEFLNFKKSPGWPTNNSLIYQKPVLRHEDKYYCFCPKILSENIKPLLESWIQERDSQYFDRRYQKIRGKYLENKAMEYLAALLPSSNSYKNLYYTYDEKGQTIQAECDGLIIYDSNILIVEMKSSPLSLSAKRGGLTSLKENLDEIIDSAYSQAMRTRDYIFNTDAPVFRNDKGEIEFEINDKNKYTNFYIINVTLANLSPISSNLYSLKNINLLKEREWPWTIFINDLRVISEILENETVFLLYLSRRIQANEFPQFHAFDELDFLMYFLSVGLYFTDNDFQDVDKFIPRGYTEDLDNYYFFLEGKRSHFDKPKLNVDNRIIELIREIESGRKFGFSEITMILLGLCNESHQEFLDALSKQITKSQSDKKDHDFSLILNDFGLTTIITHDMNRVYPNEVDSYCNLKMYQTKYDTWYCLVVDISSFPLKTYKHKSINTTWKYDSELESRLKEKKEKILRQVKSLNMKIGRNDLCPCYSGIKYKFCCGK